MTHRFPPALSNLPLIHQGKTRDTFQVNSPNHLLIVATKRLSTHDVIHLSEVPYKDQVLTALTIFWITGLLEKCDVNHHLSAYGERIYNLLPGKRADYPKDLHHRAIIVLKLKMIPVEFIFRNYLAGSLFKKFYSKGLPNPYGIALDPGLQLMSRFAWPIFTPTDKSDTDDPLNAKETGELFPEACHTAMRTFLNIQAYLRKCNLELVDSKFELGVDALGSVHLADEIVTPDSSRLCEIDQIKLGSDPPWLDKQIARDEAERIWGSGPKQPLAFEPPIIKKLSEAYLEIFHRITKSELAVFQRDRLD